MDRKVAGCAGRRLKVGDTFSVIQTGTSRWVCRILSSSEPSGKSRRVQ